VTDKVHQLVLELFTRKDVRWARKNFLATVRRLIEETGAKSVLEIGGGRTPAFGKDDIERLGISYTSNDISARELSLAPDWASKAHFDIATKDQRVIGDFAGKYDVVFSHMVMEHVGDYRQAYRNIHKILAPGGIAISYHPVLFALPFVANLLLPTRVSDSILRAIRPHRTDWGRPKFPAHYSGCFISGKVQRNIQDMGFRNVWQVPFYGHNYYNKVPGLRQAHGAVSKLIGKLGISPLAAFSYTIAKKEGRAG